MFAKWGEKKSFSKKKRGKTNHAPASKFIPPKNSNGLSVNRMGVAPDAEMAEIEKKNAEANDRDFWGWYILSAQDIEDAGCHLKESPTSDNPYHADIVIPVPFDTENRHDKMEEYANALAKRAEFHPWGDWVDKIGIYVGFAPKEVFGHKPHMIVPHSLL